MLLYAEKLTINPQMDKKIEVRKVNYDSTEKT